MSEARDEIQELTKALVKVSKMPFDKVQIIAQLIIDMGYTKIQKTPPSELYKWANGHADKYKELMIVHGYLIPKNAGIVVPKKYVANTVHGIWQERYDGWNACIDEFIRLNGLKGE